jgi:glycine hydroxymethyltransferase
MSVADPEIAALINRELYRQSTQVSLIASENTAPPAILEALGSVLANKTVEGYPGQRYHSGCSCIDEIEGLAINRAKMLFGAEHANCQPHSGVNANLAVYACVLKPGDRILAMDIAHGGHLSHGSRASFTGSQLYEAHYYSVDPRTEQVDFDQVETIAGKLRPRMIVAGYSAYPRLIRYERFREIADRVGAYLLVDMAHIAGLVATGEHPSPVPFADFVTGTCYKTLRGPRGGFILCREKYARDLDRAVFPGTQGSVLVANLAAKASTFKLAAAQGFRDYCKQVVSNARALAARMEERGVRLVAGGTDTHQVLADLRRQRISGAAAEIALDQAGIQVNKNLIPFDTQGPRTTSGLRLGTCSATTRGMGVAEITELADLIIGVLNQPQDSRQIRKTQRRIAELCQQFPIYPDRLWASGFSATTETLF